MCDTLAFAHAGGVWFAKNSDREPDEAQRVEYVAPVAGDPAEQMQATYIPVAQVARRHGYLMGRPDWMWGAEMGVNDRGLAIGNEAVFTTASRGQPTALLGMDLVRLGLERAASAAEGVDVITGLLARYGQGGPAGYRNKRFRYDNSFLLADKSEIWQLETSGRDWVAKRQTQAAISNALNLQGDYQRRSATVAATENFSARNQWLMPRLAKAAQRRQCALAGVHRLQDAAAVDVAAVMDLMRSHAAPEPGGNGDLCMHAAGLLRPTGTTNAMVARLEVGGPQVWFTGCSHPCLSLFRPTPFSDAVAQFFSETHWLAQLQNLNNMDDFRRRQWRVELAQRQREILSGEIMA